MAKTSSKLAREKRHRSVRLKVQGTTERPRLSVYRSLSNIYAQVIDDVKGATLVSASTLDAEVKSAAEGKNKTNMAELVGKTVGQRALDKGIKQVAFDRGGYQYHGRIKAVAEAARQAGLKF